MTITKIVCPTDFSPPSFGAANYALVLAKQLGASVTFLHTYQLAGYSGTTSELGMTVAKECKDELEAFVAKLEKNGVPTEMRVRVGPPYAEIGAEAKESGAQLIVMGTTGKTGLEHFLLGSVAERVVQTAPVPVLTVRHK
jgi:nucleotide-binding universal stress UspA family protein